MVNMNELPNGLSRLRRHSEIKNESDNKDKVSPKRARVHEVWSVNKDVSSPKSSCYGQTVNGTEKQKFMEKVSFSSEKKLINKNHCDLETKFEMRTFFMDEAYWNVTLHCKEGEQMQTNSMVVGLAFPELSTVDQIIGRDIILPDFSGDQIRRLLNDIIECIGSGNEENDYDEVIELNDASIKVNKLCNISKEFVPFEDESNGEFSGFLSESEAKLKHKVLWSSDAPPPKKLTPYCQKCHRKINGLMQYFHHPCKYSGKANTCRICKNTMETSKFNNHLRGSKKCLSRLRKMYLDEKNTAVPFVFGKKGNVPTFNCNKCGKIYKGKSSFLHHKCYCADPSCCRFCGKNFENNQNKSQHFRSESSCNKKLKTFDFSLLKEIPHENNGNLSQPISNLPAKKLLNGIAAMKTEEVCLNKVKEPAKQPSLNAKPELPRPPTPKSHAVPSFQCQICNTKFQGKPAFTHHECYCADPTRCRFCHQEFQSLSKKSNHFRNTMHCNKKLKLFDITQMKQVSKTPKVHLLVPKQEQTNGKLADATKVLDLSCGLCMDKFSGYISFYQHKCKYKGPETECRICREIFEEKQIFVQHLSTPRGRKCKQKLELLKKHHIAVVGNDYDDLNDEKHDTMSEIEYDKYATKAMTLQCQVNMEKSVPKQKIEECIVNILKNKPVKQRINNTKEAGKYVHIKKEKIQFDQTLRTDDSGRNHIIEIDFSEDDDIGTRVNRGSYKEALGPNLSAVTVKTEIVSDEQNMFIDDDLVIKQEKIVFNEEMSENIPNHKETAPANIIPENKTKEKLDKDKDKENTSEKHHFIQIHDLSIYMNGVPLRKFYSNHGIEIHNIKQLWSDDYSVHNIEFEVSLKDKEKIMAEDIKPHEENFIVIP